MMLSSSSIKATPGNAAKYYTQGDYYSKGADETSQWIGKGAERLGLASGGADKSTAKAAGGVSGPALTAILEGRLPEGQIHAWKANEGTARAHRPGRDFTFSAPKSVSVAALVGADERLIAAHERAVETATAFMERYALARVRENGVTEHRLTGNIVAATFLEFTSRAQDANLHTHVVVANMTFDEKSGVWRALDYDAMETAKKAGDQVYKGELAAEAVRLGYDILVDEKRGFFEIAGVSKALIDDHSTRSKQIAAYQKHHGAETASDLQRAKLNSRADKAATDLQTVKRDWEKRAGKALADLTANRDRAIAAAADPQRQRAITPQPGAHEAALRFAVAHATAGEAVVETHEIIRGALRVSLGTSRLDDIDKTITHAKEKGALIDAAHHTGGRRLYRSVYLDKDLAAEARFQSLLKATRDTLRPLLQQDAAERRIDRYRVRTIEDGAPKTYALSGEQRAAALAILTARNRIQHVQGVGGAGKTSFVGAIAKATPRRQHLAIAKTAVAARGLGEEAGLNHMTIDAFLARGGADIGRGGILFIDEASMLGTRAGVRIDELAIKNNFRVVVIGDERQLPAIEQGKPHALARRLGGTTAELNQSRRHKTQSVIETVGHARAGRVREALASADNVDIRDRKDLPKAVSRYWSELGNRDASRVLALDNATRVATGAAIRDILVRDGVVARGGEKAQILLGARISGAELKRAGQYPDKNAAIAFHYGQARHKIAKGAVYTIIGRTGETLHLERRHGDKTSPSPERIDFQPARDSVRGVAVYDVYERQIAKGDIIQWRQNTKSLDDLKNGVEGKVVGVRDGKAVIDFADGKQRTIDLARHETWDHGYALTVYKGQGATFDRAIIVAPAVKGPLLNQDTLYTAVSRARYGVDIWTDDARKLTTILTREKGGKTSALEAAGALPGGGAAHQSATPTTPALLTPEPAHSALTTSHKRAPGEATTKPPYTQDPSESAQDLRRIDRMLARLRGGAARDKDREGDATPDRGFAREGARDGGRDGPREQTRELARDIDREIDISR